MISWSGPGKLQNIPACALPLEKSYWELIDICKDFLSLESQNRAFYNPRCAGGLGTGDGAGSRSLRKMMTSTLLSITS